MNYLIRLAVFVLALLQVVTGYLITLGGASSLLSGGVSPLISPAGYAFSIWAPIVAGSLAYALYQLVSKRNASLYQAIAPWSLLVFAGYSVWLYAAGQEWIGATVGIFLVMGYALYRLWRVLAQTKRAELSVLEQVLLYGTFGLYAGWATVAIFANTAAALLVYGAPLTGSMGVLWQGLILVLATAAVMKGMQVTRYSPWYAAAIFWAYVAILIGLVEEGATASYLPVVCVLALAALAVFYLRGRAKSPRA